MTLQEYDDFRYHVEKEYYYYSHIYTKTEEDKKKLKYYRFLKNQLYNFERMAISEILKECKHIDIDHFKIGAPK